MTEQKVQTKIIKHLEGMGAYIIKVMVASKAGVPDIICCIQGRFVGIEVKKPDKKKNTSKLQDIHIRKIAEAGGIAGVAWDLDSLEVILDELEL